MAHGMTSEGTALVLHRLLEAEGVVLHAALQACALPSMGGGMGIVLKEPLAAGTTLACFPFHSMITARKARFNLAMAEVALQLQSGGDAAAACDADGCGDALRVVPFTARVWSEYEYESRIRSQRVRHAIDAKVEALASTLDSTETVVCYILLMAALHGRWSGAARHADSHQEKEEEEPQEGAQQTAGARMSSGPPTPVLRFTHENAWMRTWVHALPAQYDNLLELAPRDHEHTAAAAPGSSLPPPPPLMRSATAYATTPTWLRSYVALNRFRSAVEREQHSIEQRHAMCCAALKCLQCLPAGVEEEEEEDARPAAITGASAEGVLTSTPASDAPAGGGQACTLGQFLWAFNTLMSRGFIFPEETWAMMPFVDYFNYALDSNASMYPEEDDPDDEQGFTNALLRSRAGGGDGRSGGAALPTRAPRKQPRRTGLRSARVGAQAAVPLANYQTYTFQLVRPTAAKDEQVLLHYGAYSDMELLMWYGFTLRPSLLPKSCLPPCVVGEDDAAAFASHHFVPLLPPGLDDADGTASETALALRLLLPRVVQAETRVALFNACIASSLADDVDVREEAYNTWCTALGRAYRLPLSPLANAEGNYPAAARGATWLDELVSAFAQTAALVSPTGDAADDAAACRVDAWMRRWSAERWPAFSATAFPRLNQDCALGVLGPSPILYAALHTSFWAPSAGRLVLSSEERAELVRGLAWAELYVNATVPSTMTAATPAAVGDPASAAAATFARTASVDQWALLRFLALECSDAALEEYVAYVSHS